MYWRNIEKYKKNLETITSQDTLNLIEDSLQGRKLTKQRKELFSDF